MQRVLDRYHCSKLLATPKPPTPSLGPTTSTRDAVSLQSQEDDEYQPRLSPLRATTA